MTTEIDTLYVVQLPTVTLPRKSLPKSDIIIDDNDNLVDQLCDRYEQSHLIQGNGRRGDFDDTSETVKKKGIVLFLLFILVRSDAPVVLWLGQKHSLLRAALIRYLIPEDITLILCSTKEQLWDWLNTYSSIRVALLIIQTNDHIQDIVSRSHAYKNVRSILVRCETNELIILQRLARSYIKIDGIYDDDTRLLIKLVMDLTLFSEEIGDQQREDKNNELEAQRNYHRALQLCELARKL